jgi:ABC-type transporter Mla MlaB component
METRLAALALVALWLSGAKANPFGSTFAGDVSGVRHKRDSACISLLAIFSRRLPTSHAGGKTLRIP